MSTSLSPLPDVLGCSLVLTSSFWVVRTRRRGAARPARRA
jgi:hypothetical protein